jgi:hypothetical protein
VSDVGRTATWETRAHERRGTVAARVPAGRSLYAALYVEARAGEGVGNAPDVATVDRYLVRVRSGKKVEWFAPFVSAVKLGGV